MTQTFDFYFSFRSPYSYLAMPMIEELQARYDATATMRIVRPIAVRIPGFFQKANPLWLPYLAKDTRRIAEMNGIPYRWPRPDPIVQDRQTREVAADQPLRDQVDLDSIDFLNFLIRLHEILGVDVPEADYGKLVTLNDFVAYLRARLP